MITDLTERFVAIAYQLVYNMCSRVAHKLYIYIPFACVFLSGFNSSVVQYLVYISCLFLCLFGSLQYLILNLYVLT